MLKLSAHISIYTQDNKIVEFDNIAECTITTSLHTLSDTCTIELPRKTQWKNNQQKNITDVIRRGDRIEVKLGYNNDNKTVFKGYLKSVSTGSPVTIECEDNSWLLKQIKVAPKYYPSLTLEEFASEFLSDFEYKMNDFNLGETRINIETTVAGVMDYFIQNFPVIFFFRDGKLYGTLASTMLIADEEVNTIEFKSGLNVISDKLKYTLAEDVNVQIVAKVILQDNTKLEVKVPEDATDAGIRTYFFPECTTESELKQRAQETLDTYKVDHMEGTFTAFGEPFTRAGDIVKFYDDDYEERNNKRFFVDEVVYRYGKGGYRQEIKLGTEIHG